jgi:hypothetical protein
MSLYEVRITMRLREPTEPEERVRFRDAAQKHAPRSFVEWVSPSLAIIGLDLEGGDDDSVCGAARQMVQGWAQADASIDADPSHGGLLLDCEAELISPYS